MTSTTNNQEHYLLKLKDAIGIKDAIETYNMLGKLSTIESLVNKSYNYETHRDCIEDLGLDTFPTLGKADGLSALQSIHKQLIKGKIGATLPKFLNAYLSVVGAEDVTEVVSNVSLDMVANHIVLYQAKAIMKVMVSSAKLTKEEVEELRETYDLVIHGISRIINPKLFTQALMVLIKNYNIQELVIPDDQKAITRLARDYNMEAERNLRKITLMCLVRIGEKKLRSESELKEYMAKASMMTKENRNNGFAKLSNAKLEKWRKEGKTDKQIVGWMKGAINELTWRTIVVEGRTSIAEFKNLFMDKLPKDMVKLSEEVINGAVSRGMSTAIKQFAKTLNCSVKEAKEYVHITEEQITEFLMNVSTVGVSEQEVCSSCEKPKVADNNFCGNCGTKY